MDAESVRFLRNVVAITIAAVILDIIMDYIGFINGIAIMVWGDYAVSLGLIPIMSCLFIILIYCVYVLRTTRKQEVFVT